MKPLKKLLSTFSYIRGNLNRDKFDTVNLYYQDESRFKLITKQKRVITLKGIKPIGKYKHSYKYFWLWGSFSPITGDARYLTSKGTKLIVNYVHKFKNTCLYGSYSPVDGDSFIYESEYTDAELFE